MYIWSPLPRSVSASLRDAAHDKARVRLSAIGDLARWALTDERAACLPCLQRMLERDSDIEVRAAAALALADVGATEALPALRDVAARGEPRVRQMALIALGELAEPGDVAALRLVRAALDSDAPALRFQALVAAGRLLTLDELASVLEGALGDGEPKLRHIACRILEERFFAAAAADETIRQGWERRLEACLGDSQLEVVVAAAVLLAARGSQAAIAVMVKALNEHASFPELDDEQAAIELCGDLGLDAARPGLRLRAFGGALGTRSPLAFQARVALARLGDERARRHILRGLSSWSRNVRAQSVAAAGLARLEAARQRLLEMQRHERHVDPRSVADALSALDR
jgi:HEAT repeat protein